MKMIVLIGIAGFLGTIMRFGCTRFIDHWKIGFPLGTLTVNITGAFAAGFLFVLCRTKFQQYEDYFPVLFFGFLGAFTTFSTFALECVRFFADGQYGKCLLNIVLQNVSGLVAAGAGLILARFLFR